MSVVLFSTICYFSACLLLSSFVFGGELHSEMSCTLLFINQRSVYSSWVHIKEGHLNQLNA